jgi:hypothetical protein
MAKAGLTMTEYVRQHGLEGEWERLRLMSGNPRPVLS